MPPRRPVPPAPPEVGALRTALHQGKIVRVGIAPSGQFPDGVTGRVRRIGDPSVDGDEFIFVEVPVGGAKDVLPFAVGDLIGSPSRTRAVTPAVLGGTPPAAGRSQPAVAPHSAGVQPATERTGARSSTTPAAVSPGPSRRAVARPVPVADPPLFAAGPQQAALPGRAAPKTTAGPDGAGPPQSAGQQTAGQQTAGPENAVAAGPSMIRTRPAPARSAAQGGSVGRGRRPSVTITISTAGDESSVWRIEAKIGAKAAVRPTVIPPSRIWDIVESLGDPKLTGVVKSLLEDHRRSTQARADALATQLFELQEELKSFPDRSNR